MTHQNDYTFAQDLAEKGLVAVPELLRVLINNVMQVERSKYLQANEYERAKNRKGQSLGRCCGSYFAKNQAFFK
ncbi:MAG: hypothetical protein WA109_05675 [Bellilinea sp.]